MGWCSFDPISSCGFTRGAIIVISSKDQQVCVDSHEACHHEWVQCVILTPLHSEITIDIMAQ